MNADVPVLAPESPIIRRDRLSALIAALRPAATICAVDDPQATLVMTPSTLVLRLRPRTAPEPDALLAARFDCALPLAQALHGAPDRLEIAHDECPGLGALAHVLTAEAKAGRCGSPHAIARLFEAVLVLALRRAIDAGPPEPGLLAGLSHPRLHRALVAIHDRPAVPWTTEALAAEAGMSRSRFMAGFAEVIGTSPLAYVTRWRMGIARVALVEGATVKDAARRIGYSSPAGFRRAWRRHFEDSPMPGASRPRLTHPPAAVPASAGIAAGTSRG